MKTSVKEYDEKNTVRWNHTAAVLKLIKEQKEKIASLNELSRNRIANLFFCLDTDVLEIYAEAHKLEIKDINWSMCRNAQHEAVAELLSRGAA